MTKALMGNVAGEAYLKAPECALDIKDTVACYDDLQTFAKAVKSGILQSKSILVLRLNRQDCDRKRVEEYLNLLGLRYAGKQFVLLADMELPEKENICSVYIKNAKCGTTFPLYLIRDDDTVSLNTDTGALYLYVSDLELVCRQHQNKMVYQ